MYLVGISLMAYAWLAGFDFDFDSFHFVPFVLLGKTRGSAALQRLGPLCPYGIKEVHMWPLNPLPYSISLYIISAIFQLNL